MINEWLFNIFTIFAGGLTVISLLLSLKKALKEYMYLKKKEYNHILKGLDLKLEKQLLELEEMKKQIESLELKETTKQIESLELKAERKEEYEETKILIDNLIALYKNRCT